MLGTSEKNTTAKSSIIQIDMNDVREHLDEREQQLFMALLQTMDGKKRVGEFTPHDWEPESESGPKFEIGMCSACNEWPLKTVYGDVACIQCLICDRKVDGDERAKKELEAEWVQLNSTSDEPAGPHVSPCDRDQV